MIQSVEVMLGEVVDRWCTSGPLTGMIEIIDEVWRTNLDRHEPSELGDDATSLGVQCSRNIMNRCVQHFGDRTDDFIVRGGVTLEVAFGGHLMHVSKVQTQSRAWHPNSIDWTASGVRLDGARENAAAYTATAGTLFDGVTDVSLPGPVGDPANLTHLHLAWQGLADGETRVFVGFPTTGAVPWSAVTLVHDSALKRTELPAISNASPSMPSHDALAEPALRLRRRVQPGEADAAGGSA
jgi:hypothetical protein